MKSPLHILHLEDNPNDAALIKAALEAAGITCANICVQTRAEFVGALEKGGIDLILSDYALPIFDGLSALETAHAKWPAIPLIFVSGTLGEERAIDSLKSGATDYVLKENLSRLGPAVRRAMSEVEEREKNRRTEEVLQQTEQWLRIVFAESVIGIALVRADGHPVLTNAALQKMLGYTGDELNEMAFKDFTHPEDCATDLECFAQLMNGLRKSYQTEKRYIRKDGQIVWGRLAVSVAKDLEDGGEFAIGMVEDITERRALESQFIEAQKMEVVGQLASGVAHDFNNILAIIMGYTALMREKLGAENPFKVDLDAIEEATGRAAGLTRQLLVFSRKQTVQAVVLDLNETVAGAEKMLRRLIDENIEMSMTLGKYIGRIKADSGYIGQLLMNLVVNARDAMPDGGHLWIATTNITLSESESGAPARVVGGDYVMLSVRDTGTGMTEEVKAHLFEAFFTTKPKGKGTGLGLATCHTIVQQGGGHIDVSSELGKGTTFKVYFPRVLQPLEAAPVPVETGPVPRGKETLLVVEDDPLLRHMAQHALAELGYEVLRASNGQHALHIAREHKGSPIGLVITDVIMPQMGGKVMAEWLKSAYPGIKILFTSGYTDDAFSFENSPEKDTAFLPKPYSPATLARKVREMLDAT